MAMFGSIDILGGWDSYFHFKSDGSFAFHSYSDILKDVEALKGLKIKFEGHDDGSRTAMPFWGGYCYTHGNLHTDFTVELKDKPKFQETMKYKYSDDITLAGAS